MSSFGVLRLTHICESVGKGQCHRIIRQVLQTTILLVESNCHGLVGAQLVPEFTEVVFAQALINWKCIVDHVLQGAVHVEVEDVERRVERNLELEGIRRRSTGILLLNIERQKLNRACLAGSGIHNTVFGDWCIGANAECILVDLNVEVADRNA